METQDGRYAVRGGGVFSDEEIQLLRESTGGGECDA